MRGLDSGVVAGTYDYLAEYADDPGIPVHPDHPLHPLYTAAAHFIPDPLAEVGERFPEESEWDELPQIEAISDLVFLADRFYEEPDAEAPRSWGRQFLDDVASVDCASVIVLAGIYGLVLDPVSGLVFRFRPAGVPDTVRHIYWSGPVILGFAFIIFISLRNSTRQSNVEIP